MVQFALKSDDTVENTMWKIYQQGRADCLKEIHRFADQESYCVWEDSYLSGSDCKRNPHNNTSMSWRYLVENKMLYCPCCGKKIKIKEGYNDN